MAKKKRKEKNPGSGGACTCKAEASLVYRVSQDRTARATQKKPTLGKPKQTKTATTNKSPLNSTDV